MKRRIFALSALSLCACGGGGSGPIAPGMPAAMQLVEIYSDSTGLSPGTGGLPWPEMLALQNTKFINLSAGSVGALHALPGSARFALRPWAERMATSSAGVVVIGLCINDAVNTSLAEYAANLEGMITQARNAGKLVLLATPAPTAMPEVAQAAQAMRDVAGRWALGVIDFDAALRPWNAGLTRDGIHPTPATVDAMAALAGVRLREILKP